MTETRAVARHQSNTDDALRTNGGADTIGTALWLNANALRDLDGPFESHSPDTAMRLGIFGGCSGTVTYPELERMRIREPDIDGTVNFYLL